MKKPQLYVKNAKGRYEPYVEEKRTDENTIYIKRNNRFEPVSLRLNDDCIGEGVYVVRRRINGASYSMAHCDYISDVFCLEKVSNNYRITTEQVASLEDYAEFCIQELQKFEKRRAEEHIGTSPYERVQNIVGNVFKFSNILKEKIDREKSNKRDGADATPPF